MMRNFKVYSRRKHENLFIQAAVAVCILLIICIIWKVTKMRHAAFLARTVLVKNKNIEESMAILNNVMSRDGFVEQYRRTRYYEKPYEMRRRVNYTKCKSIYNEEMSRRLTFLMRVNRTDPYPGCS